jgi:GNAT superfamily N-acetyltransferase
MMQWTRDEFVITDDTADIDMDFITETLKSTYWAENRPRKIIEESITNSVFLSLFDDKKQIGYSRIVSDMATFAWICDVFIDPEYRERGLGKWLMECTLEHPSCSVRINLLATKDAHGLYEKYGFKNKECMVKLNDQDIESGQE